MECREQGGAKPDDGAAQGAKPQGALHEGAFESSVTSVFLGSCLQHLPRHQIDIHTPITITQHMAKHIVNLDLPAFLKHTTNILLIRNPIDVLSSWAEKMGKKVPPHPSIHPSPPPARCYPRRPSSTVPEFEQQTDASFEETGYADLMTLYAAIERATGVPPIVVDSDVLKRDPEGVLRVLCARIGIPFCPEQLSWAPGPKVGWIFVVSMARRSMNVCIGLLKKRALTRSIGLFPPKRHATAFGPPTGTILCTRAAASTPSRIRATGRPTAAFPLRCLACSGCASPSTTRWRRTPSSRRTTPTPSA